MTMINPSAPDARPDLVFTDLELYVLDTLVVSTSNASQGKRHLSCYLTKLARLGGYLARANDPPPGNMVIWRGLSRLIHVELGAMIGAQLVGN
jgi:hypothetical protein